MRSERNYRKEMTKKLIEQNLTTVKSYRGNMMENIIGITLRSSSAEETIIRERNGRTFEDKSVHSVMYLWSAAIENNKDMTKPMLIHGRTYAELREFFEALSDAAKMRDGYIEDEFIRECTLTASKPVTVHVYDHNLATDFHMLKNVFTDEELAGNVFARQVDHPIYAAPVVNNTIIKIIDSNRLFTDDLKTWADDEELPIRKHPEDTQDAVITPVTPLTSTQVAYAYNDALITMYGMMKYREEYTNTYNIPLTAAGVTRRKCKRVAGKDWNTTCNATVATYTFDRYKELCKIFMGGTIHSNPFYRNHTLNNVRSFDVSSDFPFMLATRKYPVSPWQNVDNMDDPDNYAYYVHATFKNVRSKTVNTFWPVEKAENSINLVEDDHCVRSADVFSAWMTDVDLKIFKSVYNVGEITINKISRSALGYLPKGIIRLILKVYNEKTELKGQKSKYKRIKQILNAFYGVFVTRDITDELLYTENGWEVKELTEERFEDKIQEIIKKKNFTMYQIGPWVTAYAREYLWNLIAKLDRRIAYYDTDCIKGLFTDADIQVINDYNRANKALVNNICEEYGFDPESFGNMGMFEEEETAIEFKAIGSKLYAALYEDGIETTIAGLSKEAGKNKIKSVSDFSKSTRWDKNESGRIAYYYINEVSNYVWTDAHGNTYVSNDAYAVAQIPTDFSLSNDTYAFDSLMSFMNGRTPSPYFERTRVFA